MSWALPASPVDLYLVHRSGTQFWISEGVVQRFQTPDSYFRLQDPDLITNHLGACQV